MSSRLPSVVMMQRCFVLLTLSPSAAAFGEVLNYDYDLTVDVVLQAVAGWELYQQEKYANSHGGGHYTDPEPRRMGYEFWSDGRTAEYDRDGDGARETIFIVKEGKLIYAGSRMYKRGWVDTAKEFEKHGKSLEKFAQEVKIVKPEDGRDYNPAGYLDSSKDASAAAAAEEEEEEEKEVDLSDKATLKRANAGWKLFRKKEFAGEWKGGHYTDPEPESRGKEFWSDEVIAKFDRDGGGHHESIYFVSKRSRLEYVGRLGSNGKFTEVESRFRRFKNKPIAEFHRQARQARNR